jgi:hypothetical protein
MELTFTIPDELAARLRPFWDRLPQILELGLGQLDPAPGSYGGLSDVLEVLARLPSPDEVLRLRPLATLQERVEWLREKDRSTGLSAQEQHEWEQYQYVEHLVRIAKGQAAHRPAG